jgi:YD repeat-containing protein
MKTIQHLAALSTLLACAANAGAQSGTALPNFEQTEAPLHASVQDHDDESIDPFLGSLRLQNVDLHLPGNGGFDLKVVRAYNSGRVAREHRAEDDPYTPKPLGWTVHFGRLLVRIKSCTGSTTDTNFMPLLETPDGTRRLAWAVQQTGSPPMMTSDNWGVQCSGAGFLVTAPDGTRYDMQYVHSSGYTNCPDPVHTIKECKLAIFATTRITDRNGNYATIGYQSYDNPMARGMGVWNEPQITQLATSDGRNLSFGYTILGSTQEGKKPYLTSITAATGQRVSYGYAQLGPSGGNEIFALTSVDDPVGRRWQYQYHIPRRFTDWRCTVQINCPPVAGDLLLKNATSPSGGARTYAWAALPRRSSQESDLSTPIALVSKTSSDGGTWTYTYNYDTPNRRMITTATGPHGSTTYHHRRELLDVLDQQILTINQKLGVLPSPWTTGLLLYRSDAGIQTVSNAWKGQPITDGWTSLIDMTAPGPLPAVRPVLVSRMISVDGAAYATSYANFDAYGNPSTVSENGPNGGNRTTTVSYLTNLATWIIGKRKDETFVGGSILRSFDANGNLLSLTQDGVAVRYTYDSQGNVATKTLPRGLVYTYSGYKRGIPQSETQPESVTISRVVSDAGTVTSETNGEGKTTTYTYDAVNRVTSVSTPIGNKKTIAYTPTTRTVTRGALVETTQFDGFGRPATLTLGGITTTFSHDPLGRRTFESNPNATVGKSYQYDALDRLTRITQSDGSFQVHTYGAGSKSITDERGKTTTYSFRSYGNPAQKFVMNMAAPESSASIGITRNPRDLVTSVTQDGFTRTYGYNGNYYLTSVVNPETGTTLYGRDEAGNMTSHKVGSAAATLYTYDGRNRITNISYPSGTPNVTKAYTKTDKLKSVSSSVATRSYAYDDNGNLTGESLVVDGVVLAAGYAHNANDQLATVVYPVSGRAVALAPDALGRPTQVSGFATSVSYWPSGQLKQISYANGMVSYYGQNSRLWPSSFDTQRAGSAYLSATYGYDSAGNLTQITDSVDGAYNRTMGYDGINRLTSVSGPWGSGSISYSGSGNITSQVLGSSRLDYTYDALNRLSAISGMRSASFTHDAMGNVATVSTGLGAPHVHTYDSAPVLRCVFCSNAANRVDYGYDGLNNRVSVAKAGVKTYEMFGGDGHQLVEYTPSQSKLTEYIHLGGKRIAQVVSP